MNEIDVTRAKMLGVLIQDARRHMGRTIEECAAVLDISAERFAQAESGDYILSLPDLEALAIYLKVPMSHFWGSQVLNQEAKRDYQEIILLRQRIIGTLLQQARVEKGHSLEDVAEQMDLAPDQIQAYENGLAPIPYFHLEKLAKHLGCTIDHFGDSQGPLARHEVEQKIYRQLDQMPLELRLFVAEPINQSYLETAKHLSEMDVRKLRAIGEALLDITF